MAFDTHEQHGLVWLTSSLLNGVRHGFTTRKGGVSQPPFDALNLGISRGDRREDVLENYARICGALGMDRERMTLSQQTHSTNVRRITEDDAGKGLLRRRDYTDVDAMVTDVPGLPLAVFSADCGIILLYDPIRRAIGAAHAGWRGCAGGILENTVRAMADCFASDPRDLRAAIGPCIGQCCFETDGDVPEAMTAALGDEAAPFLERRGAKYHVDLAGLNRQWLLRAGLMPDHIDVCGLCTACRPDLFWSHRKMGDARGAQTALISL